MKILAIGDIHGLDTWKEVVANHTFDVCVFVGDYFDSFDLDTDTQIKNFKEIMEFRKDPTKQVVTILGNHDLHYLLESERYSGYQHLRAADIKEVLTEAITGGPNHDSLLQIAYEQDGFLFTHAGVTKTWAEANAVDLTNIEESINSLGLQSLVFNEARDKSMCGEHKSQGPVWVRPTSLMEDAIEGFTQIVGHTRHRHIRQEDGFVFIDALWANEFLTIEDDKMIINKIV